MFKGLGNLASLIKNAQGIGSKIEEVSERLRAKRAVGSAGGGMVTVEVNGLGQVLQVTIEPSLIDNDERDMIQDLLPAAFNQASAKAKQMHVDAMKEFTGGLALPGLDQVFEQYMGPGDSSKSEDEGTPQE